MNRPFLALSVSCLGLIAAMTGCSGSSSGKALAVAAPTASAGNVTLAGKVYAAPVKNGRVDAYLVGADGLGRGAALGFGATDGDGRFSFGISVSGSLPGLLLVAEAGSYTEEASGAVVTLGVGKTLSLALSSISSGRNTLSITPLSTIAAELALSTIAAQGRPVSEGIDNANRQIAAAFGVSSVTDLIPTDVTDPAGAPASISSPAAQLGMLLGGFSHVAAGLSTDSPGLALALAQDVKADGVFDGSLGGLSAPVTPPATAITSDLAAGINAFAGSSANQSGLSAADTDPLETFATNAATTLTVAPTVSAVTPSSGASLGNESVVVSGAGFSASSTVQIGGKSAAVTARDLSAGPQTLTVTTPSNGPGAVDVVVADNGYTGTKAAGFTFVAAGSDAFVFQGGTDKWRVDFTVDADGNGVEDLLDVLRAAKDSTGGVGAFASDLDTAKRHLLSYCSQYYHNNADGTLKAGGIPVSVQARLPSAGTTPAATQWFAPTSTDDYNTMAMRNVAYLGQSPSGTPIEQNGTVGLAITEDRVNDTLEHNAGEVSEGPLGVRLDAERYFWNLSGAWSNSQRTLEEWMRHVASTLAHEIGHSMGINQHTNAAVPSPANTNIMTAVGTVGPDTLYDFDATWFSDLRGWTPGQGRRRHRSAWAPRLQLAASDHVVIASIRGLVDGVLRLNVEESLHGALPAEAAVTIAGFDRRARLDATFLAGITRGLFFLRGIGSTLTFSADEGSAIALSEGNEAAWRAIIADYRHLEGLERTASPTWTQAYARRLAKSLSVGDARIEQDAFEELHLQAAVTRAFTAEEAALVARRLVEQPGSDQDRVNAARFFTHRRDGAFVAHLMTAGYASTDAEVHRSVAGALEMTLGLQEAAQQVRQAEAALIAADPDLPGAPAQVARRRAGTALVGWLKDRDSLERLVADLSDPDQALAQAACDALGRVGDAAAVPGLAALAEDARRPMKTRRLALRAIGRLGGSASRAFFAATPLWRESQAMAVDVRMARDFARSWIVR